MVLKERPRQLDQDNPVDAVAVGEVIEDVQRTVPILAVAHHLVLQHGQMGVRQYLTNALKLLARSNGDIAMLIKRSGTEAGRPKRRRQYALSASLSVLEVVENLPNAVPPLVRAQVAAEAEEPTEMCRHLMDAQGVVLHGERRLKRVLGELEV